MQGLGGHREEGKSRHFSYSEEVEEEEKKCRGKRGHFSILGKAQRPYGTGTLSQLLLITIESFY